MSFIVTCPANGGPCTSSTGPGGAPTGHPFNISPFQPFPNVPGTTTTNPLGASNFGTLGAPPASGTPGGPLPAQQPPCQLGTPPENCWQTQDLFSTTTGLPPGLGTTDELYLGIPGGDAYAFQTAPGSAGFATVSLPSTASGNFMLHLLDGTPDQQLSPGETLALNDVAEFELIGTLQILLLE